MMGAASGVKSQKSEVRSQKSEVESDDSAVGTSSAVRASSRVTIHNSPEVYAKENHPASGIRHPASGIRHPASSIQHPASSIRHPASSIQHPTSSIRHLVSAFLLTLLLAGCGGGSTAVVPTFVAPTPRTVSSAAAFITRPTYEVTVDTLTEEISVRGELMAVQQADLIFRISGMLKSVAVVPGQTVAAGEHLAELDAPTQQQNLLQRRSNLAIAELNLQKQEAGGANTFDLAIAREQVALAESLHALAQQQHAATVLAAPFAGTIVAFSKQQGSRVDAYEAVGVLADLGGVTVRGYLPAEARDRATVGLAAVVQIDGYGGTPFAGKISEIAAEAVMWQGRLAYKIGVTLDPDQALPTVAQIGADIALAGATHADVPWVPANALITLGSETYLDLLTAEGIRRLVVETGIVEGQRTEIVSGVQAGDTIVFP
jgi:RND family efflux transporter MFP subunit